MSPAKQDQQETVGNGSSENLEGRPEGWRPNPGDEVVGKIADLSIATSTQRDRDGNYPQYPLLLIEKEDGSQVFVHCFHQTLQRALLEARPEIGQRIEVKFLGKQTLKSDASRSVAIYTMKLPDTPKTAKTIYDRLEKAPARRSAPRPEDSDLPWSTEVEDDDFLNAS